MANRTRQKQRKQVCTCDSSMIYPQLSQRPCHCLLHDMARMKASAVQPCTGTIWCRSSVPTTAHSQAQSW